MKSKVISITFIIVMAPPNPNTVSEISLGWLAPWLVETSKENCEVHFEDCIYIPGQSKSRRRSSSTGKDLSIVLYIASVGREAGVAARAL